MAVSLHRGMGPLYRLCDGGIKKINHELIWPNERLKRAHVPILKHHTSSKLEKSSVVAATENPRHIIRELEGVRAKAASGKPTLDGSHVSIHHGRRCQLDVHSIQQAGDGVKTGGRLVNCGFTGRRGDDLARGRERG